MIINITQLWVFIKAGFLSNKIDFVNGCLRLWTFDSELF